MKLKRTHIWIILMIVILIVAVVAPLYIESTKDKEGFACTYNKANWTAVSLPQGTWPQWDVSNINVALNSVSPNFGQINLTDQAEATTVIKYFVHKGVKVSTYTIPGNIVAGSSEFPANGNGICMKDDGYRTVYFKNNRKLENYKGDNFDYNSCKSEAIRNGATVFALQYGGQCFIGNSNDIALGRAINTNGFKAYKLDDKECGGRYGRGGGWSQNVYAKTNTQTQLPSTTYYYLDKTGMINIVNNLRSSEGGGNLTIHDAICKSKQDNSFPI